MKLHLEGISFRPLADQFGISVGSAYNYVQDELNKLPHCADITRKYCRKFSGCLQVDGKFLKVKTYQRKIPVVYGVDYGTHDIPHFILSKSENYQTCQKFFSSINLMNYPLHSLVCDDNINIQEAAQDIFPNVAIQICHLHLLRNIKYRLDLDENKKHKKFYLAVKTELLMKKRSSDDFDKRARSLLLRYKGEIKCVNILLDLHRRKSVVLGYLQRKKTPITNNLIECFNSHLNSRLQKMKGFQSTTHAKLWLNAYFLRRRTKKFTDCNRKFNRLNGKKSLEITKKPNVVIPDFFN